jgi:hypothetical protein
MQLEIFIQISLKWNCPIKNSFTALPLKPNNFYSFFQQLRSIYKKIHFHFLQKYKNTFKSSIDRCTFHEIPITSVSQFNFLINSYLILQFLKTSSNQAKIPDKFWVWFFENHANFLIFFLLSKNYDFHF